MMDRRLIAGLLGLLVSGCAHARSGMPETGKNYEPVSQVDALPPIKDSINQTTAATDAATQRASHDPATLKPPANSGGPTPAPAQPILPPGRPAPFADRAATAPRLQAPPTSGRPEGQPAEARPAPFVDQTPANPRPQTPPTTPMLAPASATESLPPISANLPAISPLLPATTAAPAPVVAADLPKVDAAVIPTAAIKPQGKPKTKALARIAGGGQAAMVGNEVITLDQLRRVLKDQLEGVPDEQKRNPETQRMIVDSVLNKLIERTLILQAVKKQIKDPKNLQTVYDSIDKGWIDQELPPLLRKSNTPNIYELKRKLAEQGKSLDALRDDFRKDTLAHEFMLSKIQSKMNASLPEKQRYYTAHVNDFNRPAQVTWREIAIENAKCASRAEAKAKAEALLARIKKGEDFAKVARAESHGATAREGGLWEIAPGGYGVPEINEAIAALAPGKSSGVIEVPGGFHIVLVENKREAGPARFDEVQDQIKDRILREKFSRLADNYINDLKKTTIITTMFDTPKLDPSAMRASAEAPPAR
jgi:parvulin-like peptidyl-prolyl isomerase